ncbi:MAG: alpha/beta hydrolase [Acidobacteria bacterium]|nr:alpha/beta hydrolase [Acidobacteriota bacterium]
MSSIEVIEWAPALPDEPAVVGSLHEPVGETLGAIVLTHGAGGDRSSALLVSLCDAFARLGWAALRCDLPYRQKRPSGPPSPSGAKRDQEGLARALDSLREKSERVFLGGSSYGGRQASMLLAERPELAHGLLLLSYPLHPPGKPEQLRTAHFPSLQTPTLFAHGSKDVFGEVSEMREAQRLIPAPVDLLVFEGASHGLIQKRDGAAKARRMATQIAEEFQRFVAER